MPCSDYQLERELSEKEKQRAAQLEAAMCAVFNELERRGIAEQVIAAASTRGRIDLAALWREHQLKDWDRLLRDFNERYSQDEQELLKKVLTDG
jgi:hypothetical protein